MVIRLGKGEKRWDVKAIRKEWQKLTTGRQLKIVHVSEDKVFNLVSYLANQKRKKGLGAEMSYQSAITRWRWSAGWIPRGFTKAFSRFWARVRDETPPDKEMLVRTWIQAVHEDPGRLSWVPLFETIDGNRRILFDTSQGVK